MRLQKYIESFTYNVPNLSRNERIEIGRQHLFDFTYPFYEETERKGFETRLIKHFYMRSFGAETAALTKLYLEDYLTTNMPYWNKLFESELQEFPIFEDMDYSITENETVDGTTDNRRDTDYSRNRDVVADRTKEETKVSDRTKELTENQKELNKETNQNSSDGTTFNREIFTNTPETDLKIVAPISPTTGVINTASSIDENAGTNSSTGNSTTDQDNTTDKTQNEKGQIVDDNKQTDKETNKDTIVDKQGVVQKLEEKETKENTKVFKGKKGGTDYADLMLKYRSTLMRIEKSIFKEINEEGIFLLVYGGR